MQYDNDDTLKLIFNKMRWGTFLAKYWTDNDVIFVHAKAISKAYEKVHPIPAKSLTYHKYQEWIKPFLDTCEKISQKEGKNHLAQAYVNEELLKDFMDKYAGYLYTYSNAQRDYDLEVEFAKITSQTQERD